jgi:hypothetical protein
MSDPTNDAKRRAEAQRARRLAAAFRSLPTKID